MIFYTTYAIRPELKQAAQGHFSQMTDADDARDHGDNVKMIGRWHDIANGTGVVIAETDNIDALYGWLMNWSSMCSFVVTPVLDDASARAAIKQAHAKMQAAE